MEPVKSPIKEARLRLGASQETFAGYCFTSKQAVIRAEQGCYADPPPAIMKFLRRETDLDEQAFLVQYREFQRGRRKRAYGLLTPLMDWPTTVAESTQHPFIMWREGSSLNQTQVCKFWCLHPAIIYKFEKQPHLMNDLPESLVEALLESGYKRELINALRLAYSRYKAHLASGVTVSYGS